MSNFSRVSGPGTKLPEGMNEDGSRPRPREIAGAVNLMVHPLAGAAAFSALGVGLASHAFGVWVGALAGAAEMSQRLLGPAAEGQASGAAPFPRRRGSAGQRAAPAARTLIADARSAVLEREDDETGIGGAPAAAAIPSGEIATEAAARSGLQPAATAQPPAPDDLKAISGIGPKLEKVLNGLGIWSYAQIAGWSRPEIAWVNRHLSFNGRVERDDWIGQARTLARNKGRH